MEKFESPKPKQETFQVPIPDQRAFALKLDEYYLLRDSHPEELERLAKMAGKTPDAFIGMMETAKAKGDEDMEIRKARIEELEERSRKYRQMPDEIRMAIIQWIPSNEEVRIAEENEKNAYTLFDTGDSKKAEALFFSSMLIEFRRKFGELAEDQSTKEALDILRKEVSERLRITNIPELRSALTNALQEVQSWMYSKESAYYHRHRNKAGEYAPTGPSEVFEIDSQKRSPTNGRSPYRINDEHEGW